MMEFQPISGTIDYLLEHWIVEGDIEWSKTLPPERNPFGENSPYDWYAGYAKALQPRSILEIGVRLGYSIAAMLGEEPPVWYCRLVDDNAENAERPLRAVARKLYEEVGIMCYADCINTQTQWREVPLGPYDIVHIDAGHAYEHCLNDLRHFAPLVSDRGIVIVDDQTNPDVARATEDFLAITYWQPEGRWRSRYIDNATGHMILWRP